MVSNKKKVFLADGLFVVRVKKYIAIGSGSEIALGALAAGVDVKKAVEITCAYNTLCGLPVVYTEVPI
jgi:ATP-dependent protease HslVU (ClpYQ) peptidase subunit